jgi:cell division septal protein FtsQ
VRLSVRRTGRRTRRSQPSPFVRLRSFWLVWLLLGALLAVAVYQLILWPGFHLRSITVNGTSIVSSQEVVRRAGLDRTQNIWLQNMHAAAARIEAIPWVDEAHVHRTLPASVVITVVERSAQACVAAADGTRFTIDAHARVLENGCARLMQPLFRMPQIHRAPVPGAFVHAVQVTQLQRDASALEALEPATFVSYVLDAYGQLEGTMRSGVRVEFGADDDLGMKTRLLDSILKSSDVRLNALRAVDLRAPQAPVVDYR